MKSLFFLLLLTITTQAKAETDFLPPKCQAEGMQITWSDASESLGKVYFRDIQACVNGLRYSIVSSLTKQSARTELAQGLCKTLGFTYFVGALERSIQGPETLATFSQEGKFEGIKTYQPIPENDEFLVTAIDILVCKGL